MTRARIRWAAVIPLAAAIALLTAHTPVRRRTITQMIYARDQRPVIHTPGQVGLEGWGPGVIGWFAATPALLDTIAALVATEGPRSHKEDTSPAAGSRPDAEPSGRIHLPAPVLGITVVGTLLGLLFVVRRGRDLTVGRR